MEFKPLEDFLVEQSIHQLAVALCRHLHTAPVIEFAIRVEKECELCAAEACGIAKADFAASGMHMLAVANLPRFYALYLTVVKHTADAIAGSGDQATWWLRVNEAHQTRQKRKEDDVPAEPEDVFAHFAPPATADGTSGWAAVCAPAAANPRAAIERLATYDVFAAAYAVPAMDAADALAASSAGGLGLNLGMDESALDASGASVGRGRGRGGRARGGGRGGLLRGSASRVGSASRAKAPAAALGASGAGGGGGWAGGTASSGTSSGFAGSSVHDPSFASSGGWAPHATGGAAPWMPTVATSAAPPVLPAAADSAYAAGASAASTAAAAAAPTRTVKLRLSTSSMGASSVTTSAAATPLAPPMAPLFAASTGGVAATGGAGGPPPSSWPSTGAPTAAAADDSGYGGGVHSAYASSDAGYSSADGIGLMAAGGDGSDGADFVSGDVFVSGDGATAGPYGDLGMDGTDADQPVDWAASNMGGDDGDQQLLSLEDM